MNSPDESKVQIDQQRLIDLIELELWSKFQKRLWGVISGFLVLVTVAGLFGIPYFIEAQTQRIFISQSKKYQEDVQNITSHTKAYLYLLSRYENYHQRIRQDIYTVLLDLEEFREAQDDQDKFGFRSPEETLKKILHETDPRKILGYRSFFSSWGIDAYEDVELSIQETIHLENTILSATGSTSSTHPYRNGKYKQFLEDIKIRLLILSAYRNSLDLLSQQIFEIGSNSTTDLAAKTRALEVKSIIENSFEPSMNDYLASNWLKLNFAYNENYEFKDIFQFYITELNIDANKLPAIAKFVIEKPKKETDEKSESDKDTKN